MGVDQAPRPVDLKRLLCLTFSDHVDGGAVESPEPKVRIVPARTVERRYSEGRGSTKLSSRTEADRGGTAS